MKAGVRRREGRREGGKKPKVKCLHFRWANQAQMEQELEA